MQNFFGTAAGSDRRSDPLRYVAKAPGEECDLSARFASSKAGGSNLMLTIDRRNMAPAGIPLTI